MKKETSPVMRPYEEGVEFSFPWRVEEDWTYEIKDAEGRVVATTPFATVAALIVKAVNEGILI